MRANPRNIFVVGLDDAHLADIRRIPDVDRFRFHALLHTREVVYREHYPIDELLERARQVLRECPEPVHAIIGHWDFPVSVMVPILCAEQGLLGPSLSSVLMCEHKYWARVVQQQAIPRCTPDFCAVDPFVERPYEQVAIDFPFWIKPVKAYGAALGFHVRSKPDFERAIAAAREGIRRFGDPFNRILERVARPPEVRHVGGNHLIAEQFVGGRELAPEGYVQHGRFHVHGMIDMVRGPNKKSFSRYEYPSTAPREVQQRAIDAAERALAAVGYDNGCFNIEFFWDEDQDRLWIIEINTRISQSHSYLFALVEGMSNHEAAIHVALGDAPEAARRPGRFRHAAKFLHRRLDVKDAVARRVPGDADLARLRELQPETHVKLPLHEGMRLSELKDQDPYSYVLAEIDIGAASVHELREKYQQAADLLPFELVPCDT